MEKSLGPIPAFYACYLLRSIARHSSLYIGSTPHPPRRLRQHNGESKGGAARTSKDSLRPWEMTCLVTGFPSKIAALQFEWAWQNPNLTRHIDPESRITASRITSRISPKTGKVRKRAKRPSQGLSERLRNLRILLRAKSFRRWPLNVTFYAADVFKVWSKLAEQTTDRLRPGVRVALDESSGALTKPNATVDASRPASPIGIQALDVGYFSLKSHIEKSRQILGDDGASKCCICHAITPKDGAATLVCPCKDCTAVSHLRCMSSVFLQDPGREQDTIVPTTGACPQCRTELAWPELVKELTLRMRGEKEMKAIFKPKRAKKGAAAAADSDSGMSDDDEEDPLNMVLIDEAEWHDLQDSSEDEKPMNILGGDVVPRRKNAPSKRPLTPQPERIIEESDWDGAKVLT